jgi:hypothetical protein
MNTQHSPLILLACLFVITSCSEKKSSANSSAASPAAASPALAKVFASAPAGDPVEIMQARASAKPGETITLKGLVMGSTKPFVEGRAAFTLGDPAKLTPCNKNPDDSCETPWDVCCETPEAVKAATVTIQVVDADGRVLKEPVENVQGLNHLSEVIVTGKVTASSNADLLVLNADSIKVVQ